MNIVNDTHEMIVKIIIEAINLEHHELIQKISPDWVDVSQFIQTIKKNRSLGVEYGVEYAAIDSLSHVICVYCGVGVD